jgi:magnesium transporter
MFRVLEVGPNGPVQLSEGTERVGRPTDGHLRWIDLVGQDEAQLEILRDRFDFHPLAIEDCAHFDQRPKVEEYGGYLFVVTQGFSCSTDTVKELDIHELHTFVGNGYLVTVHERPIPALENVWQRAVGDPALVRRGLDFLAYLIIDGMVDDNFPILDLVADELESIEDAVLSNPRREDLARIFELKHHLVQMRKVLSPQRDALSSLSKRGDARVSERTSLYFRDVYDHLVRIVESIEANRDLLGNALEAYLSAVSQRTNEIMKYLTIMSAVFLPLAFVVGFFGQNFDDLPGFKHWPSHDGLMWLMIALCISIPVAMVVFFKKKNWL